MTDERPTPETDELSQSIITHNNTYACYEQMKMHARCLERERDEARERADTMFAKHADILDQAREQLSAERSLADRLADVLELYYADDAIAHHAGIADTLAAWKEARSE